MVRLARGDLFDPAEVSVLHSISRCVRRCFLCGHDPQTGKRSCPGRSWDWWFLVRWISGGLLSCVKGLRVAQSFERSDELR